MLRRFMLYLIGVGIGTLVVYFTLIKDRNRDLGAWLPNNRTVDKLKETVDTTQSAYLCFLKCHKLTTAEFKQLLEKGSVDFSKSEPREEPAVYFIHASFEGLDYSLEMTSLDTLAKLTSLEVMNLQRACNCN